MDTAIRSDKKWYDRWFANRKYYLLYTCVFAVMTVLVYLWYIREHKSFIYGGDGFRQHYKALLYYAQYLRGIFKTLLTEHRLVIPEWGFNVGEGSDIIQTFHYYVIGDPFAFPVVFVPLRFVYIYYVVISIARLYFAGIIFSWLCRYMGNQKNGAILAGSIAYAFSLWGMMGAVRHPYFLNPMVFFPLIIIGVEKILREGRFLTLTFAVAISALSNFYFFYMLVLLTIVYVLVRLLVLYRKEIKLLLKKLGMIAGASVWGVLLAAVILLPVCYAFLGSSRMESVNTFHLFYSLRHYHKFPALFIGIGSSSWLLMGFAVPAIFAVYYLFTARRKNGTLKILVLLVFIFALFPIFGQALNGFSYQCNRWSWAMALAISYSLTVTWPEFLEMKRSRLVQGVFVIGVYALICHSLELSNDKAVFQQLWILFAFWGICMFRFIPVKYREMLMMLVMMASIVLLSDKEFSPGNANYIASGVTVEQAKDVFNNATTALNEAVDEQLRDRTYPKYSGRKLERNDSIFTDYSTTQFYWSIASPAIAALRFDMALAEGNAFTYFGLDDRTYLLDLASVKYYILSNKKMIPREYQFVHKYGVSGKEYHIYENTLPQSVFHTYDRVLDHDQYESLAVPEKAEAMMQAVLLEDYNGERHQEEATLATQKKDYQMELSDGIVRDGNTFVVTNSGATMTLSVSDAETGEFYLSLSDVLYTPFAAYDLYFGDKSVDPLEQYGQAEWEALSEDTRRILTHQKKYWTWPDDTTLTATSSHNIKKEIRYQTPESNDYYALHDFVVNLGYQKNKEESVTITFPDIGIFEFGSIDIYCQPMEHYTEYHDALMKAKVQNLCMENDEINADITVEQDQIISIAVPYSKGWTLYVDGEKTDIYQANIAYMAFELEKGQHAIRLVYHTPLFRVGIIVSLTALLGLMVWVAAVRRKKGKHFPVG